MRKYFLFFVFLIGLSRVSAADSNVAVTVYNNDLALIKEYRTVPFQKGIQEYKYKDVAARIEPTSVHFKSITSPESIALLEQNFEYDLVGTIRLLEKYINQDVVVMTKEQNAFSGMLLNALSGDIILKDKEGKVKVIKSASLETVEFPSLPEGLVTEPTLIWLLNADKAGDHDTEISYLTKGINWHAEYVAVSNKDDSKLELGGWVSIENRSGATYKDAKLKLVAGDVNIVEPRRILRKGVQEDMMMAAAGPQFEEKEFFEYHLYTLPRPATIKDRQMKQLSLFPNASVQVDKLYTYNGQQDGEKVRVNLEFINSKSTGLGLPLPAGKIRVYKQDDDGSQEFVGEDIIDHTPKDEKAKIYLGNAFDIVGERVIKDVQQLGKRSRQETVEITLRNHKKEAIQVIVVENFWGDWQFVGDTPPIKKKDAQKVEFNISIDKDAEKVFEYTVLYKR